MTDHWTASEASAAAFEQHHNGMPAEVPDRGEYMSHQDEHAMCTYCSSELCDDCSHLSNVEPCVDGDMHCESCWTQCGPCRDEASREWWDEHRPERD